MASDDEQHEENDDQQQMVDEGEKKVDNGKIKIPAHLMEAASAPAPKPAWMQKLAAAKAGGASRTRRVGYRVKDEGENSKEDSEASEVAAPPRRRGYKVKRVISAASSDDENDETDHNKGNEKTTEEKPAETEPTPELEPEPAPARRRGYKIKSVNNIPPSGTMNNSTSGNVENQAENATPPANNSKAQEPLPEASEHSIEDPVKDIEEAQENDTNADPYRRSSQSQLSASLQRLQQLKQKQNIQQDVTASPDKEEDNKDKGLLESLGGSEEEIFEDSADEEVIVEEVTTDDDNEIGWASDSNTEEEVVEGGEKGEERETGGEINHDKAENTEATTPLAAPEPPHAAAKPSPQQNSAQKEESKPSTSSPAVGVGVGVADPTTTTTPTLQQNVSQSEHAKPSTSGPPVGWNEDSFAPPRQTRNTQERSQWNMPRPQENDSYAPPRRRAAAVPTEEALAPPRPNYEATSSESPTDEQRPPDISRFPKPPSETDLADSGEDDEDDGDWMIPRRNDDDSSWVNPSHPIQPDRKDYLSEELKKKSVDLFPEDGQPTQRMTNLKSISEDARFSDLEYDNKVGLIVEQGHKGDGQTISETSFSEVSSKVDSAKVIENSVPNPDMDVWALPSQEANTYRAAGILESHKDGKDYRFSYIAQQHTHSTSNYADVVRERYFPKKDNEYWAAPAKETKPELPLHISRNGTVKSGPSDENESWMPPENDPAEKVKVDRSKYYAPSIAEEKYSETRSVSTEGSDWMARTRGSGSQSARVDFAGAVSQEQNPEDAFVWNPTKEPSLPSQTEKTPRSKSEASTDASGSSSSEEGSGSEADDEDEFATNSAAVQPRPPSPPATFQKDKSTDKAKASEEVRPRQYDYSPSGRLKFDMTPQMILIEDDVERGQSKPRGRFSGKPEDKHKRFLCCMTIFFFLCMIPAAVACIVIFVVDPNDKRGNEPSGPVPTIPAPSVPTTPTQAPAVAPNSPTATFFPEPSPAQDPVARPPMNDGLLLDFLTLLSTDDGAALRDESSPQYAAMQWLKSSANQGIFDDDVFIQRFALATLYYSTGGSQWSSASGWLTAQSECQWFTSSDVARICDGSGSIVELHLGANNLAGSLPPELNLLSSSLLSIQLHNNKLTGQIPSDLGDLKQVETLQLSQNQLRGTIPPSLGSLPSLRTLFLYRNLIQSTIPTDLGNAISLMEIDFGANSLKGTIPTQLGRLDELESLSLYDNELTGSIPIELSTIHPLRVLYLDSNDLGPTLPLAFCDRVIGFNEFWTDCKEIGGCSCCTKCCQDGQPCA